MQKCANAQLEKCKMNWQVRRMSAAEYRRAINQLGMNTAQAGRFLGLSTASAYRYEGGDAKVPVPVSLLLRLMIETGVMPAVPPHVGIRARRAAEQANARS